MIVSILCVPTYHQTMHCMLILNAPSFFSLSWGIIKKLIDPRTAQRIQVFSNEKKGLARLSMLISEEELPQEYGGEGMSLKQAFQQQSVRPGDPPTTRQEVQLIYLKSQQAKAKQMFQLKAGEKLSVRIYTRSVLSAKFTLTSHGGSGIVLGEARVCGKLSAPTNSITNGGQQLPAMQTCQELAMDISGPGKFVVEGSDLDSTTKKEQATLSRGYFLVEGKIM
jgi:hypothetical protein